MIDRDLVAKMIEEDPQVHPASVALALGFDLGYTIPLYAEALLEYTRKKESEEKEVQEEPAFTLSYQDSPAYKAEDYVKLGNREFRVQTVQKVARIILKRGQLTPQAIQEAL